MVTILSSSLAHLISPKTTYRRNHSHFVLPLLQSMQKIFQRNISLVSPAIGTSKARMFKAGVSSADADTPSSSTLLPIHFSSG